MAYIQLDLDAIKRGQAVAGLVNLPPPQVLGGLGLLWNHCRMERVQTVSAIQVEALFWSGTPRLLEALTAFGFLEKLGPDEWRVRGLHRYRPLDEAQIEARRKGGLAARNNLKQYASTSPAKSAAPGASEPKIQPVKSDGKRPGRTPAAQPVAAGEQPDKNTGKNRLLDPRSEILEESKDSTPTPPGFGAKPQGFRSSVRARAQNPGATAPDPRGGDEEKATAVPDNLAELPDAAAEVFAHWEQIFMPQSARGLPLDKASRRLLEARLREGFSAADLRRVVDGAMAESANRGASTDGFWRGRNVRLRQLYRNADAVRAFLRWAPAEETAPPPGAG